MAAARAHFGNASAPPSRRILRDSAGWFAEGESRKRTARNIGRCAECFAPLPDRRRVYCGPSCQWKFHGRYFWDAARVVVMRRDRYRCRQCGERFRRRYLEVDHIVEVAAGGASLDYSNLQTLCRDCHRGKTVRFLRTRRLAKGAPTAARGVVGPPEPADWFPA